MNRKAFFRSCLETFKVLTRFSDLDRDYRSALFPLPVEESVTQRPGTLLSNPLLQMDKGLWIDSYALISTVALAR